MINLAKYPFIDFMTSLAAGRKALRTINFERDKIGLKHVGQFSSNLTVPKNGEITLFSHSNPLILDNFEWVVNQDLRVLLRFQTKNSDNEWVTVSSMTLGTMASTNLIMIRNIVQNGSNQFVILDHDNNENIYKAATKREMYFVGGLRILASNTSTNSDYSIGFSLQGRETI